GGNGEVGQGQHQRGGKPQPQCVGSGGCHRQQRAQSQQLYQCGVVLPQPLDNDLFNLVHAHSSQAGRLLICAGSVSAYNPARFTAFTTARGVMVAPVNWSNSPPSFLTANAGSAS